MVLTKLHIAKEVRMREEIYRGWVAFLEDDYPLENSYPIWYHFLKHQAGICLDVQSEVRLVNRAYSERLMVSRLQLRVLEDAGIFDQLNPQFSRTFAAKWGILAMRELFASWGTDSAYVRDLLHLHLLDTKEDDVEILETVQEFIASGTYTLQELAESLGVSMGRIIRAVRMTT